MGPVFRAVDVLHFLAPGLRAVDASCGPVFRAVDVLLSELLLLSA